MDIEKIKLIDTTVKEDFKISFFENWKNLRASKQNPLTPEEENYYGKLHNKGESNNFWLVLVPGAFFFTFERMGVGTIKAVIIGLIAGATIKIVMSIFGSLKNNKRKF